jgi:hypothetical protein
MKANSQQGRNQTKNLTSQGSRNYDIDSFNLSEGESCTEAYELKKGVFLNQFKLADNKSTFGSTSKLSAKNGKTLSVGQRSFTGTEKTSPLSSLLNSPTNSSLGSNRGFRTPTSRSNSRRSMGRSLNFLRDLGRRGTSVTSQTSRSIDQSSNISGTSRTLREIAIDYAPVVPLPPIPEEPVPMQITPSSARIRRTRPPSSVQG